MKRTLVLTLLLIACVCGFAQLQDFKEDNDAPADSLPLAQRDSLRISLLTCDGYDEVWALYGHSALRIQNMTTGMDFAVNYGLFDFRQPFFPLKFALGHCDYLMGLVPFQQFLKEFTAKGAGVFEQELNLTFDEKISVLMAIDRNNLPENRMYRYNFYYDNCASRPRDIVLDNIPRRVEYTNKIDETKTYRQLIHEHNEEQLWCRFGNDILLGVGSDRTTNREQQQFLPENLMRDFAEAWLVDGDGKRTPLVVRSQWVLPRSEAPSVEAGFPLSPGFCAALLFIVCLLLRVCEWLQKKNFWLFDAVLLAFVGVIGLLLLLMLFSEHPTVRLNLQILVFNPLIWLFWWKAVKYMKKGGDKNMKKGGGKIRSFFILYSLLCVLTLAAGSFVQDFAEGFFFFTLALIARLDKYQSVVVWKAVTS